MKSKMILDMLNDKISDELEKYRDMFAENKFDWEAGISRDIAKPTASTWWEIRTPMNYNEGGIHCRIVGQTRKFRKPMFTTAKALEQFVLGTAVVRSMKEKASVEIETKVLGERHMGYVYYIEFSIT